MVWTEPNADAITAAVKQAVEKLAFYLSEIFTLGGYNFFIWSCTR
jgi:hypothetical protein